MFSLEFRIKNQELRIIILTILSFLFINVNAQTQLFPRKEKTEHKEVVQVEKNLVETNVSWQKQIKEMMTAVFKDIQENPFKGGLYFIFLAFIYGALHALGPGHGKFIVSSYFLTRKSGLVDAFALGLGIGLVHAISGIIVHAIIVWVLEMTFTDSSEAVFMYGSRISYALIIVLGAYFLFKHLRHHDHGKEDDWKTLLSIAFVPCPAAMIVLSFAYAQDFYGLGILSALALGLGIGIVVGLFGVLSTSLKGTVLNFVNKSEQIGDKIHNVFSLLGNTLIILLGILFLYLYW
jgi:ABC-type nickel/cobalt efflux system permease component RcnA